MHCKRFTQEKIWVHLKLERKAIHEGSNRVSARWWENIITQEQDVTEELKFISLLLWVRGKMPEMETKFPDYTGKLTEFAVNKLIFIRSNFVNFFVSLFCYFLCFSYVLTSPSVPTNFVKLIFFTLQVAYLKLDTFSLLHFTTLWLFLVHTFFSRFFQGKWKISNCKASHFLLSAAGFLCHTQKLKANLRKWMWIQTWPNRACIMWALIISWSLNEPLCSAWAVNSAGAVEGSISPLEKLYTVF